ncbi:hypothetical protein P3T76_008465 [Phytophthora citrophthora]|uniref:Serine protease family S33 n=1 Tax=Phytophthora citrophthora TaxID=4793 RepID=A0AAD9GKC2_9STRA|nr:hypothetical protein P3T76_008465 [Phytophthora citrophthora]
MLSTTNVAKDIASFMGEHTNGEDTIVFGRNYGAVLGERLMHLNPPEVTGYVFDGIATTAWTSEYPWDTGYDDVADTFLALSQEDEEIAARFKKKGLAGAIKRLIAQFDKNPESTCAVIINSLFNNTSAGKSEPDPPSFVLRFTLGVMLLDSEMRKMIPPIVYRLNRCADQDLDILKHFTQVIQNTINPDIEDENYQSPLLDIVIYYSEMWQMSPLSMAEVKKRYADVLLSNIGLYSSTELYCAYSMEKSKPCLKFKSGKYDDTPILYKNDEYWNKRATIPTQASVLLLSGKLDGQTTNKYAEHLLNALKGDNKELIAFEHATQGTIVSTPLIPGDPKSPVCGMELLVSYIKNGGNLERMDKSCVKKMPPFNMTILTDYLYTFLATDDAYDGVYNESLSKQSGSKPSDDQSGDQSA